MSFVYTFEEYCVFSVQVINEYSHMYHSDWLIEYQNAMVRYLHAQL